MNLDFEQCDRARLSRDPRFDGKFFVAVRTTGVYCRPICPVPPAKRANIRFYPCAAAAEEAGYRPCMRCRPEASPGTPAWIGTSTIVSRALKLIREGALDDDSVEALASRVGVGARHLRRLFLNHLGATPRAIARTRRVHFASRLLQETDLPMTRVAQSAGFSSLRRFNATVREVYGRPPTLLRRNLSEESAETRAPFIELRLAYRPPYDWDAMMSFLGDRATSGVEAVAGECYRRSFELDHSTGVVEVKPVRTRNMLLLRIHSKEPAPLFRIVDRVRRMFDLCADPTVIQKHLAGSRRLRDAVRKRPGLRVPGSWDPFELAVRAILGQQVSVSAARTLSGRLAVRFGTPFEDGRAWGISRLFPSAEQLLDADVSSIGIPKSRARTIHALCEAVCKGSLSLTTGGDPEESIAQWTRIPGIGRWTAEYIAMRAFKEPDAFPTGDLGLIRALSSRGERWTATKLAAEAESWRPWRAYATMYLWTKDP